MSAPEQPAPKAETNLMDAPARTLKSWNESSGQKPEDIGFIFSMAKSTTVSAALEPATEVTLTTSQEIQETIKNLKEQNSLLGPGKSDGADLPPQQRGASR